MLLWFFIVNFENIWHVALFVDAEHVKRGWNTLLP